MNPKHVTDALLAEYCKGIGDGMKMVLDAVLGDAPPGAPASSAYDGYVPHELRTWIEDLKAKVATS